jgi:CxxC motif-containing protein (DUF1111 family)
MEARMKRSNLLMAVMCLALSVILATGTLHAQKDTGPRPGPAAAGGPGSFFPTLNADEQNFFNQAFLRLQEVQSVSGKIAGEDSGGLGPTFNGNSCTMCHAQPAIGGSSPGLASPQNSVPNPQVALATLDGAMNFAPSFITANGPVREARFIRNPDGSLDGGVHGLYTIKGRTDAVGCNLGQPNFDQQLANNNVIFRIPTPLFGLGLVENTPDATLRANLAATQAARFQLGIGGTFNTSGNDGTITRFGWKAQNKSLLIFAGEAYNVEQGVSNELFPNERSAVTGCVFNQTPEDATVILNGNSASLNFGTPIGTASEMLSDTGNFAVFMRLSAPPTPGGQNASAQNGSNLFNSVGCALCHSPSLTTADSIFTGMGGVTYQPFSDFALHHMGAGLADGINQGAAGPDQFRTAPLWGVGQRLFFLHDGRTSDLLQAIQAHSACRDAHQRRDHDRDSDRGPGGNCGSEADGVIRNFNGLSPSQQQDILNFLRSL